MTLNFPSEWSFNEDLGRMPDDAVADLISLIERIASDADRPKSVYETFKSRFGVSVTSSSESWALTDMTSALRESDKNIPEFLDSFWTALTDLKGEVRVPPPEAVNKILRRHTVGYVIQLLKLVREVAAPPAPSPAGHSAPVIGYSLHEKLGCGGFGEVFRATRPSAFGDFEFAVELLESGNLLLEALTCDGLIDKCAWMVELAYCMN